jgi:uncharacterized protein
MTTDVNRLATITWLAENAKGLGRTALMKYCYFLQAVCGVPLGYHFSLYSYGPFDSDVLSDLDSAESMGGVKSSVVYFPGGYGYRIEGGDRADRVKLLGGGFIDANRQQLQWVTEHFGGWDASDLEVASTLVYSDREAWRRGERLTTLELSKRVRDLKPRYTVPQIEGQAERLAQLRLFKAVQ